MPIICTTVPMGTPMTIFETTVLDGGGIRVDGFKSTATASAKTNTKIPSKIMGRDVVEIAARAFEDETDIVALTVEGSPSIGARAFEGCSSMTSASIHNATTVGTLAFYDCSSLTDVDLHSATSIGSSALSNCPVEVIDIASLAEMPFGLLAFTNVRSLDISSVTTIGSLAFSGCKALASVTVGDALATIGDSAFSNCTALKSFTVPSSVTSFGNSVFSGCTALESVDMGASLTEVPSSTFSNCTALKSFAIPDTVTAIGSYAFYNCKAMTTADIPDGVTSIGNLAFYHCEALATVDIPDGVTEIADNTFYGCVGLVSLTIGNGVETIGEWAFYNCQTLSSLTLGSSVATIGEYAFAYCKVLASLTVPSTVTAIGDHAFYYCNALSTLTIPDSVVSLGASAFGGCTSLVSLTIGNGVTAIGADTFNGCTSLTSLTIPDGVTSVGERAFAYGTALLSVSIGSGVDTIGSEAFKFAYAINGTTVAYTVKAGAPLTSVVSTAFGGITFKDGTSTTSVPVAGKTYTGSTTIYSSITLATGAQKWYVNFGFLDADDNYVSTTIRYRLGDGDWQTNNNGGSFTLSSVDDGTVLTMLCKANGYEPVKWSGTISSTVIEAIRYTVPTVFRYAVFNGATIMGLADYSGGDLTLPDTVPYVALNSSEIEYVGAYSVYGDDFSSVTGSVTLSDTATVQPFNDVFKGAVGITAFLGGNANGAYAVDGILYVGTSLYCAPSGMSGDAEVADGTTAIGANAFLDCTQIASISFPDSLATVDSSAFPDWNFYASDGVTLLDKSVASNLAGKTFTGSYTAMTETAVVPVCVVPTSPTAWYATIHARDYAGGQGSMTVSFNSDGVKNHLVYAEHDCVFNESVHGNTSMEAGRTYYCATTLTRSGMFYVPNIKWYVLNAGSTSEWSQLSSDNGSNTTAAYYTTTGRLTVP